MKYLIIISLLMSCNFKQLEIIDYTPLDYKNDQTISVTFSDPPSYKKLITSFKLFRNATEIPGAITLVENRAIFEPYIALEQNFSYTVIIDSSIEDRYGNSLANDFSFQFEIGSNFNSLEVISCKVDGNIELEFSEPPNRSKLIEAFSITPFTKGEFSFEDNFAYFNPEEIIGSCTILINNSLIDIYNNSLEDDFKFEHIEEKNIELVTIQDITYDNEIAVTQEYQIHSFYADSILLMEFNSKIEDNVSIDISPYIKYSTEEFDDNSLKISFNSTDISRTYLVEVETPSNTYYFRLRNSSPDREILRVLFNDIELINGKNISLDMIEFNSTKDSYIDFYTNFVPTFYQSVNAINITCHNNNASFLLNNVEIKTDIEDRNFIRYHYTIQNSIANRGLINVTFNSALELSKEFSLTVVN